MRQHSLVLLAVVSLLITGCAGQSSKGYEDRSILVLVEDGAHDALPNTSSVARRVVDGINEQLHAAGFTVYDASVLKNVARDSYRLNADDLVDLAKHNSSRTIDIAAATAIHVTITPVQDYSQRIQVRVNGRAVDVKSGRLLGAFDWSDRHSGQFRVSSRCKGSCLKEQVGDRAREIGQAVGRELAEMLGASAPRVSRNRYSRPAPVFTQTVRVVMKNIDDDQYMALEEILVEHVEGYIDHDLVSSAGTSHETDIQYQASIAKILGDIRRKLAADGWDVTVYYSSGVITLKRSARHGDATATAAPAPAPAPIPATQSTKQSSFHEW